MLTLKDKKIDFLRNLICMFYEQTNDTDRICAASTIVGILDYIISTENITERTDVWTREGDKW